MFRFLGFFNREEELLSTFQPEVFADAVKRLKEKNIPYRAKARYSGHGNRGTGTIGSIGERVDLETQYRIFVGKQDFEMARHLLGL